MRETRIGDAMSTGIVSVAPHTPIAVAREVTRTRNVRHLLVTAKHDLVGVVCACDFAPAAETQSISSCMASPVLTIPPDATLEMGAYFMRDRRVGCLPVVAGGELVGIVTRGDLRRRGFSDEELGILRCVVCGWAHNVIASFGTPDVGFCLFCRERSVPPSEDTDLGGSG